MTTGWSNITPYLDFWSIDHHKSDPQCHTYCAPCRAKIPRFLNRHEVRLGPPFVDQPADDPVVCEACGARPVSPL